MVFAQKHKILNYFKSRYQMVVPWQARQQAGFTLIEMMVVVAIIGIMAAMAYPSMQKQIAQMRLKDAVNASEMAFRQARVDALIMRANVDLNMNPSAHTLQMTQTQNSNTNTQTINFNNAIVITPVNSMPQEITFTPTKTALKKSDQTPIPATTNTTTPVGYAFCYQNITTDKYVVMVDALTNVKVVKNGTCS